VPPEGSAPERIGAPVPPEGSAPERIGAPVPPEGSAPERIGAPVPPEGSAPERVGAPVLHERSVPERKAKPGRHIPAVIRRHVWVRDGGRCTFADASGRRCRERSGLEVHHEQAFARGGSTTVENLRLLCRAHNALLAERDFGRAHLVRMRNGGRPR
jgi:hypothetical protein